jgi:hypothetical protein
MRASGQGKWDLWLQLNDKVSFCIHITDETKQGALIHHIVTTEKLLFG